MATAVIVDQETREEALLIEPVGQYITPCARKGNKTLCSAQKQLKNSRRFFWYLFGRRA
jgi:hypothetical protein